MQPTNTRQQRNTPSGSRDDYCTAIEGVEYDVHVHSLGVLDVSTGAWAGGDAPYCSTVPWLTAECPPGCEDHHRIPGGIWIHRSPYLDALLPAGRAQ